MARPTCKDCATDGLPATRKAPFPGPRCATHHRAQRQLNRNKAHGRRLATVYGITPEEYERILTVQGGCCFICVRAKGYRKRLSVDHDHDQAIRDGHAEEQGCPECVRGLLCQSCNKMLGHGRDDPEFFERAADYLRSWPSKR
jgi:hypothetical protein